LSIHSDPWRFEMTHAFKVGMEVFIDRWQGGGVMVSDITAIIGHCVAVFCDWCARGMGLSVGVWLSLKATGLIP
jgi:hypothetical protein